MTDKGEQVERVARAIAKLDNTIFRNTPENCKVIAQYAIAALSPEPVELEKCAAAARNETQQETARRMAEAILEPQT
jgi:phenylacetate-coenzyme A ligase PaaK-like adenylate-forming protein